MAPQASAADEGDKAEVVVVVLAMATGPGGALALARSRSLMAASQRDSLLLKEEVGLVPMTGVGVGVRAGVVVGVRMVLVLVGMLVMVVCAGAAPPPAVPWLRFSSLQLGAPAERSPFPDLRRRMLILLA